MDQNIIVEYKKRLCETMKAFIVFCEENNLTYMACGGTAIGALRHGGIIPWDDDIDVYMLREDYDRMLSIRKSLDNTKYCIATPGDEDYNFAFSKFYDATTTLVELPQFSDCVIGVYVDIFPLDVVTGSYEEIQKKKDKYDNLYLKYQYSFWKPSLRSVCSHLYFQMFKELYYMLYTKFMSTEKRRKLRRDFVDVQKELAKDHGDKVLTYISIYGLKKEIFEKKWFDDTVEVKFEDFKIRIPAGYDNYLSQLYGDYMTPPPVEKQVTRHFHYYLNLKERLTKEEVRARLKKGEKTVY